MCFKLKWHVKEQWLLDYVNIKNILQILKKYTFLISRTTAFPLCTKKIGNKNKTREFLLRQCHCQWRRTPNSFAFTARLAACISHFAFNRYFEPLTGGRVPD